MADFCVPSTLLSLALREEFGSIIEELSNKEEEKRTIFPV
jgi:hypothetical protein